MPDPGIDSLTPSQSEVQPKSRLSRSDFLKASAAVGFAAVAFGVKVPTKEQVEAAYRLLAQGHARRLEGYVDPVDSYPAGSWCLTSVSETPFTFFEDRQKEDYGIPTDMILEDQGLIKHVKGDYVFTNGDKRLLVHLGSHGQHSEGITEEDSGNPKTIEKPNQLGAISVDSVHSFSVGKTWGLSIKVKTIKQ